MLARLSGRWHSVFTGVSLVQGERHLTFSCETRVRFFDLTAAEIDAYIATGECMDKAGAYGIQGYGRNSGRLLQCGGLAGKPIVPGVE